MDRSLSEFASDARFGLRDLPRHHVALPQALSIERVRRHVLNKLRLNQRHDQVNTYHTYE